MLRLTAKQFAETHWCKHCCDAGDRATISTSTPDDLRRVAASPVWAESVENVDVDHPRGEGPLPAVRMLGEAIWESEVQRILTLNASAVNCARYSAGSCRRWF